MRDFKFRAWDKSRNEWSQQSFAIDQSGELHMWKQQSNSPNYSYGHTDLHPVICVYTGLTDKNGVEIYEGDIFNCIYKRDGHNDHVYSVEYSEAYTRFGLVRHGERCPQDGVVQTILDVARYEVIGNIHENPELLEKTS